MNKLLIRYSLIAYGTYVKYDHNGVIDETVSIPLRSISQQLLLAILLRCQHLYPYPPPAKLCGADGKELRTLGCYEIHLKVGY